MTGTPAETMSDESLQRNTRVESLTRECVRRLPFILGPEDLELAQKRMLLAFSHRAAPGLYECTEASIATAVVLSAMSGLYPGGPRPDVWLIPRYSKKANAKECNWQISSRGFVRLAHRAGYTLLPGVVYECDAFEAGVKDTVPVLNHSPNLDEPGTWETTRCGYVVVTDPKGQRAFKVLRKDQLEERRKMAQTDKIWSQWPEEMTLKTMAAYAGAREMWPTDQRARYAMTEEYKAVKEEAPLRQLTPESLTLPPSGARTDVSANLVDLVDLVDQVGRTDAVVAEYGPPGDHWVLDYKQEIEDMADAPER